ncbi:DNA polymerase epsilon subunit 4-like [Amphiura filiformis]|uniref:DNA polymerase epsilon subunit 4-like n=1 Tax=Amphiura filiformis TaxID=82378 RepID=UPI003B2197BF
MLRKKENKMAENNTEPREIETEQEMTQNGTNEAGSGDKPNRITKFPMTRIKTIMKTDPDVTLASQESVVLISRATELFLEHFAKSAYAYTSRNKRKTIKRQDVDSSVDAMDAYAFLEGTFE